jgi:predicted Zn-dependent protease
VDAAAGAIVSWGKNIAQRAETEKSLLDVLKQAKDLDTYAEQLEADVASSTLENPTVRKALGKVYAERKDFAKAAKHLQAAADSGPVDQETVKALVAALDAAGKPEEADSRLLALARSKAHDFGLWKELGDRLAKRRLSAEAERARTTLAEMSANESEGHAALAAVREAEKRFQEAANHWRQVIRIRSKEPAGYLGLAKALLAAGDPAGAAPVLEEVLGKSWPARFGKVREEALELRLEIEKAAPR